jgi:ATP-dependent protease HslVU (ClpYQ) peptidase subunit
VTCIVAIEHHGDIYVGGDSAAIDDVTSEIRTRSDEKVFIKSCFELHSQRMIIGFAGSFRIGQLLRYSLEIPEHKKQHSDMEYLVVDFIDSIRSMQKDKGSLIKVDEVEEHDSELIVGYKGKIYIIESDFQVGRLVENYAACGIGAQTALGALYATKNIKMQPEERIKLALSASAEYTSGVREPFTIMKLNS